MCAISRYKKLGRVWTSAVRLGSSPGGQGGGGLGKFFKYHLLHAIDIGNQSSPDPHAAALLAPVGGPRIFIDADVKSHSAGAADAGWHSGFESWKDVLFLK